MTEESSRAWKDQYMLRLPDGMRDQIKAAAEANNRSMNAEIVARLTDSFDQARFTITESDARRFAFAFLQNLADKEPSLRLSDLASTVAEMNDREKS